MGQPNFFIVGAPKCGTTSLYEYLKDHPNIFLPQQKEPHYFAADIRERRSFYTRTADEYRVLFADTHVNHKAIGEGSVWYLYSDTALQEIYAFNKNSKIIVMLRNPVDMVYSLHSQMVYSFTEERKDFETAWREQSLPIQRPVPALKTFSQIGKYAYYIEKLFSIFPNQQIKILIFEEFIKYTKENYEEVLSFLELPSDNRTNFPRINAGKEHTIGLIGRFIQRPPRWLWKTYWLVNSKCGGISHIIMKNILSFNNKVPKRKTLALALRKEMIEEFSADIDRLSLFLDRDLSHWKK